MPKTKMIQVRHVPDAVHRRLKAQAAEAGMSLSGYVLAELEQLSRKISNQELARRVREQVTAEESKEMAGISLTQLIRDDRDRRSA